MNKFYSDHSRSAIIQKIAQTESTLSSHEINIQLKALYYRRYLNLLDTLNKKLKELNI